MNPFKSKGFDSLIAKGLNIKGQMALAPGSTTQLDGTMSGESIAVEADPTGKGNKVDKTTLVVNGLASTLKSIVVPNVTITGHVTCDVLEVVGILAIKKGAIVTATKILYATLIVETGAIINGHFEHISFSQIPVLTETP